MISRVIMFKTSYRCCLCSIEVKTNLDHVGPNCEKGNCVGSFEHPYTNCQNSGLVHHDRICIIKVLNNG